MAVELLTSSVTSMIWRLVDLGLVNLNFPDGNKISCNRLYKNSSWVGIESISGKQVTLRLNLKGNNKIVDVTCSSVLDIDKHVNNFHECEIKGTINVVFGKSSIPVDLDILRTLATSVTNGTRIESSLINRVMHFPQTLGTLLCTSALEGFIVSNSYMHIFDDMMGDKFVVSGFDGISYYVHKVNEVAGRFELVDNEFEILSPSFLLGRFLMEIYTVDEDVVSDQMVDVNLVNHLAYSKKVLTITDKDKILSSYNLIPSFVKQVSVEISSDTVDELLSEDEVEDVVKVSRHIPAADSAKVEAVIRMLLDRGMLDKLTNLGTYVSVKSHVLFGEVFMRECGIKKINTSYIEFIWLKQGGGFKTIEYSIEEIYQAMEDEILHINSLRSQPNQKLYLVDVEKK